MVATKPKEVISRTESKTNTITGNDQTAIILLHYAVCHGTVITNYCSGSGNTLCSNGVSLLRTDLHKWHVFGGFGLVTTMLDFHVGLGGQLFY